MVAVSLLLLQIFSETYTPKEKNQCVGVTYKGVAYKAKKASRSRFTGRVVVTMRDEPPRIAAYVGTPACMQECVAKNSPQAAPTPDADSTRQSPNTSRPAASPHQQESDEQFFMRIAEQTTRQFCAEECAAASGAKKPTPKPGRQIDLAGADTIVDSTSCTCPAFTSGQCMDK